MAEDLSALDSQQDILQAALGNAFTPPSIPAQPVAPPAAASYTQRSTSVDASSAPESVASSDDAWKSEYEAQVQEWRSQSAVAREKAEKERKKWEAIRAAEKEEAARRRTAGISDEQKTPHEEAGWETVGQHMQASSSSSSNPVEAHELVPSNTRDQAPFKPPTSGDESQKWDDIPSSLTSSFPSMTFPERTNTPSPEPHTTSNPPAPPPAPLSATVAIFDSSLSTKARVSALFSSLAINMLLPFVNGVMLGFGEIFAKNVILKWFGWNMPTPARIRTGLGLGVPLPSEQRPRRSKPLQ